MPYDEARYMAVWTRCSAFGRTQLEPLRDHAALPDVLALLETIKGNIYGQDIQQALYDCLTKKNDN